MFRKILIGMFGFLVVCALAAAGYHFGQQMAQHDRNTQTAQQR